MNPESGEWLVTRKDLFQQSNPHFGSSQLAVSNSEKIKQTAVKSRLDRLLTKRLQGLSRSRLAALIRDGLITINGRAVKAATVVRAGDRVRWTIPPARPALPRPQDIPLDIIYEDAHLIVINKPAGLVVHPGAGVPDGTLVNALLHHCQDLSGIGGVARPGIVHRLDKGTSGVMVAAKHDRAHQGLARQFARRLVHKQYRALVIGVPCPAEAIIDTPFGRHPTHRMRYSGRGDHTRRAITSYTTLTAWQGAAELQVVIATGRTHQIRVHLYELGYPIIGDQLYSKVRLKNLPAAVAGAQAMATRPLLHAHTLTFHHPVDQQDLTCTAPLPDDYLAVREQVAA